MVRREPREASRRDDHTMIMSIVRHPLRAKYADDWPQLAASFTAATRAEPGNICFDWFRSVDDPNVYLLVEMFRDRAAGDAHVDSDHFEAAMSQMGHAYSGMPEVVHVEVPGEGWSAMAEVEGVGDE
jgi:quinol monooxygenase YgiN